MILFPGALGDLLLALPALHELKARHAAARMTLVVSEPLRALASLAGLTDVTASLDGAEAAGVFGGDTPPPWLSGRPVVYSWLGAGDDTARRRIRAAATSARFFRVERGPGTAHAAVAYAAAVGARSSRRVLAARGRITPPPSAAADALYASVAGPVLAVHAGAGARAKRWDRSGLVDVARWWCAGGGSAVAIAGPAEALEPSPDGMPEVRDWSLPDLAAVLGRAAFYLGHDSGVSHLAGAVGTAGIVLFGPTSPARWRPMAGALVPLRALPSGPDGISLAALPVARVLAACRRQVGRPSAPPFALTRGDLDTSVAP